MAEVFAIASIASSIVQICDVSVRLCKQVEAIKQSEKSLKESLSSLQQELVSLQQVLGIVANVRNPDNVAHSGKLGEKRYLDELHLASLQDNLLGELRSLMREIEVSLIHMMKTNSLANGRKKAHEWQGKIRALKLRLIVPHSSPHFQKVPNGVLDSHPTLAAGEYKAELPRCPPRNHSDCGSNTGDFRCTYSRGCRTSPPLGWRRYEEGQDATLMYAHASGWQKVSANGYSIGVSLVSVATSATTAICMRKYDQLHNHQKNDNLHRQMPSLVAWLEPTPTDFVTATIAHGVATLMYYVSRKMDRYRECFLATGTLAAAGAAVMIGSGIQGVLLSIMPLALISSLVLCTLANVLLNHCKASERRSSRTVGERDDEKNALPEDAC